MSLPGRQPYTIPGRQQQMKTGARRSPRYFSGGAGWRPVKEKRPGTGPLLLRLYIMLDNRKYPH